MERKFLIDTRDFQREKEDPSHGEMHLKLKYKLNRPIPDEKIRECKIVLLEDSRGIASMIFHV